MYTVKYLGNVVEGNKVRYLNVEMNRLKDLRTYKNLSQEKIGKVLNVSKVTICNYEKDCSGHDPFLRRHLDCFGGWHSWTGKNNACSGFGQEGQSGRDVEIPPAERKAHPSGEVR